MSRISRRIGAISESATLAVDAKAKALKAAGRPVIGFGAGEPDFPTPDYIVEAAVQAARDPKNHRYSPAGGLPELREAVAAKTLRDSGYEVAPSQVLITNGGKQAVYNTFAALLDPEDEVIVPAGRRQAGGDLCRPGAGLQGHRGAAGIRAHRAHQDPALRFPVQPDRRRLHPGAGPGDRPVGRGARPVGCHR